MASPTYTLIASNTLSASAASVTFSSIPSTYTDLVLKISERGSSTTIWDNIPAVRTSAGGTLWSSTLLTGTGAAAQSFFGGTAYSVNNVQLIAASSGGIGSDTAGNTANTFSNIELYIPNYNSTSAKPFSSFGVAEQNGTTAYMSSVAGLWRASSAITDLVIVNLNGANFVTGSSFYLYGIKNA